MSRDVITVGMTMRIPLLYRGEYSQWRERFMNYLEEQTDGEAMINSIQNGDQPLPVIAPLSLAGTTQNVSIAHCPRGCSNPKHPQSDMVFIRLQTNRHSEHDSPEWGMSIPK
nr:hypothetical protein [Tanacetum cinerariifolium]